MSRIEVLMVTSLNEPGDIERASECGTNDFVSKPVSKRELLIRVRRLLEGGQERRAAERRPAALQCCPANV